MKINKIEIISYIILGIVVILGVIIAFVSESNFQIYVKEDGIIEYSTAFFLLFGSLISLFLFVKSIKNKRFLITLTSLMFFVGLFFVAGEEISWGQRIFQIETTDYFKEKNMQGELNLHNLKIAGLRINLILAKVLSFLLVFYLIILPILYNKLKKFKLLLNKFGIPVAKYHHSIVAIIVAILIFIIPSSKKWELLEFAFSFLIFIILLFPFNKKEINTPIL